jgi:3-oxoacyl-[acyl-carrier-protein] synthase-3
MRAYLSGTGSYLPARVMTNQEVCARAPTSDEWIRTKLGIVTRRIAAPDEQASDLAVHAARGALEMAALGPDDLDGILCAVNTGDVHLPATASYVQRKLGCQNRCFGLDIKIACAGPLGAILMARGLVEAGLCRHVLVTGVALLSRTAVNWEDRRTAPIFGDGAGAVVVSPSPDGERGILQSRMYTDGTLTEIVRQVAGGSVRPLTPEVVARSEHTLDMDGRAVWECAERTVPAVIREVVQAGGYTVNQVDFLVSHQANRNLLMHLVGLAGISPERTLSNVDKYGNTGAASSLVALDEAVRTGRVKPGMLVVLVAIGAGMTWGAHLLRW